MTNKNYIEALQSILDGKLVENRGDAVFAGADVLKDTDLGQYGENIPRAVLDIVEAVIKDLIRQENNETSN